MWQRSPEIICLYISSKAAKGLWEKSGVFGDIDSPCSWLGLKQEDKGKKKQKQQLELLLVPEKETAPPFSQLWLLSTSLAVCLCPGSFLDRRQGMVGRIGWTSDL